jgi:hypothetical protein
VEEAITCKSGAPTLDGGRSSSMRESNLSTGRTARSLKSKATRMKKDMQLASGPTMVATTKNGQFCTQTRLTRLSRKDLIRTSVSTETDHSISDQDFQ